MKGVLIVGHGSRQKSTERILESVVEMVRPALSGARVEIAYMEFGARNISDGLDALVRQGAEKIAVVPYFLFDGVHIREDIPQALKAFQVSNPHIEIELGRPFGVDERLAAILSDRAREVLGRL